MSTLHHRTAIVLAIAGAFALLCAASAQAMTIDPNTVTYTYPGLGSSTANPAFTDTGGTQLSDGVIPADSFASGNWAGFNDNVINSGQPEPRIDFALGGAHDLSSATVTYVAGGLAGILGPDRVEVRYSTNGGATFSPTPDVVYSAFDQSDDDASQFPVTSAIALGGTGVTNVRMDFIQDSGPGNAFSEWVFLGEVNFQTGSTPTNAYKQAVLADNPLLYWTFDETTGNAQSLVNNTPANELSPQGDASRSPSHVTPNGINLGNAAAFNGTTGTQFLAADLFGGAGGSSDPGVDFIATQLWAVEFWFNTQSANSQYISESIGVGGSNDPGIIYGFNADGPDQLELFKGDRFGPTGISQDEWHHAVIAFYGNNSGFGDNLREIYVDGVLAFSDTTTAFSTGHSLEQYAIGNSVGGVNPFNGLIDEYAIYELGNLPDLAARRAHVADIAAHFNATIPIPEPATILLLTAAAPLLLRRRRHSTASRASRLA